MPDTRLLLLAVCSLFMVISLRFAGELPGSLEKLLDIHTMFDHSLRIVFGVITYHRFIIEGIRTLFIFPYIVDHLVMGDAV